MFERILFWGVTVQPLDPYFPRIPSGSEGTSILQGGSGLWQCLNQKKLQQIKPGTSLNELLFEIEQKVRGAQIFFLSPPRGHIKVSTMGQNTPA